MRLKSRLRAATSANVEQANIQVYLTEYVKTVRSTHTKIYPLTMIAPLVPRIQFLQRVAQYVIVKLGSLVKMVACALCVAVANTALQPEHGDTAASFILKNLYKS
jgi:hypothetical protein